MLEKREEKYTQNGKFDNFHLFSWRGKEKAMMSFKFVHFLYSTTEHTAQTQTHI